MIHDRDSVELLARRFDEDLEEYFRLVNAALHDYRARQDGNRPEEPLCTDRWAMSAAELEAFGLALKAKTGIVMKKLRELFEARRALEKLEASEKSRRISQEDAIAEAELGASA